MNRQPTREQDDLFTSRLVNIEHCPRRWRLPEHARPPSWGTSMERYVPDLSRACPQFPLRATSSGGWPHGNRDGPQVSDGSGRFSGAPSGGDPPHTLLDLIMLVTRLILTHGAPLAIVVPKVHLNAN